MSGGVVGELGVVGEFGGVVGDLVALLPLTRPVPGSHIGRVASRSGLLWAAETHCGTVNTQKNTQKQTIVH